MQIEIFPQLLDMVDRHAALRRGARVLGQRVEQPGDGLPVRQLQVVELEILHEGIGEDLYHIGLRQQTQWHRRACRCGRWAHGEARHQAGRLFLALRIEIAQEVQALVAIGCHQRLTARGGDAGDQVGLAGLRGAEDRHAGRAPRRYAQPLGAPGEAAKRVRGGGAVEAERFTIGCQPRRTLARGLRDLARPYRHRRIESIHCVSLRH